jgi:hypothetical protein
MLLRLHPNVSLMHIFVIPTMNQNYRSIILQDFNCQTSICHNMSNIWYECDTCNGRETGVSQKWWIIKIMEYCPWMGAINHKIILFWETLVSQNAHFGIYNFPKMCRFRNWALLGNTCFPYPETWFYSLTLTSLWQITHSLDHVMSWLCWNIYSIWCWV